MYFFSSQQNLLQVQSRIRRRERENFCTSIIIEFKEGNKGFEQKCYPEHGGKTTPNKFESRKAADLLYNQFNKSLRQIRLNLRIGV
jgi:hypothetical protein